MKLEVNDDGSGPVVVLLHGFPLDRTMWGAQELELSKQGYRVIAPNLRGVGGNHAPGGVYTMDSLADDVFETLDDLGIREPVVVGGLSMGGYVALAMIANHPERFRGLMLLCTRATADTPAAAEGREKLARQVEESNSVNEVVAAMFPKLFAPETYTRNPSSVEEVRATMLASNPRAIANTLRGLGNRPDRTGMLASIRVPTLVLGGEQDQIIPRVETEAMAAAIPNARLEIIGGPAGHLAPIENPQTTNALLLDFLQCIDG